MYRKASEELRREHYKDLEKLRVHVLELVKHINVLLKVAEIKGRK
jgi:hypothetical protein